MPRDYELYRRVSGALLHFVDRMSYYEADINDHRGSSMTLPDLGGQGVVACRKSLRLSLPINVDGEVNRRSSLREDFVVELQEIRAAFLTGLQDADQGNEQYSYMLGMNLTRNLSVLPEDLVTASQLICEIDQELGGEETTSVTKKKKIPRCLPATLECCCWSLCRWSTLQHTAGCRPACQDLLHVAHVCLWCGILSNRSRVVYKEWPTSHSCLWHSGWPFCSPPLVTWPFVVALDYTTVGNAVILSNAQSLIMLVGRSWVWKLLVPFSRLQEPCCVPNDVGDASADASRSANTLLLGDFFAIISAVGGVEYLALAKTIRPHVDIKMFVFLVMAFGSSLYVILITTVVGTGIIGVIQST